MKRFIYKTIFLVIPIIAMLSIAEFILRKIPNDYSYKNEYLKKHATEIEILFLGSSHAYFGIDPEFLKSKKGFNGAHVGQKLAEDIEILKKHIANLNNLEFLVLPIDYFTLFKEYSVSYVKNYRIYYGIKNYGGIADDFEMLNFPLKSKIIQISNFLLYHNNNITCNTLGWGTSYKSTDQQDLVKQGKIRAVGHTVENCIFLDANIQRLKEIIAISKAKKFNVVFYTSPAYYTYIDYINPDQLNTTINTINKIVNSSENLYYFNFLKDPNFVKEDFWDSNHLNEIGAEKLTLKLDSLINNID
ncbi:hypothetical protein R9C00_12280 [Flammeovirgaceae bacterium SG7u.111]|nr:hypothetical protein [Flammeovirgaceae bacterium SG7u.132]WPO38229.1 hypothetical protein R9C00_12280 [Flammeovirgaceae bacterium SG7u.111]